MRFLKYSFLILALSFPGWAAQAANKNVQVEQDQAALQQQVLAAASFAGGIVPILFPNLNIVIKVTLVAAQATAAGYTTYNYCYEEADVFGCLVGLAGTGLAAYNIDGLLNGAGALGGAIGFGGFAGGGPHGPGGGPGAGLGALNSATDAFSLSSLVHALAAYFPQLPTSLSGPIVLPGSTVLPLTTVPTVSTVSTVSTVATFLPAAPDTEPLNLEETSAADTYAAAFMQYRNDPELANSNFNMVYQFFSSSDIFRNMQNRSAELLQRFYGHFVRLQQFEVAMTIERILMYRFSDYNARRETSLDGILLVGGVRQLITYFRQQHIELEALPFYTQEGEFNSLLSNIANAVQQSGQAAYVLGYNFGRLSDIHGHRIAIYVDHDTRTAYLMDSINSYFPPIPGYRNVNLIFPTGEAAQSDVFSCSIFALHYIRHMHRNRALLDRMYEPSGQTQQSFLRSRLNQQIEIAPFFGAQLIATQSLARLRIIDRVAQFFMDNLNSTSTLEDRERAFTNFVRTSVAEALREENKNKKKRNPRSEDDINRVCESLISIYSPFLSRIRDFESFHFFFHASGQLESLEQAAGQFAFIENGRPVRADLISMIRFRFFLHLFATQELRY